MEQDEAEDVDVASALDAGPRCGNTVPGFTPTNAYCYYKSWKYEIFTCIKKPFKTELTKEFVGIFWACARGDALLEPSLLTRN